MRPPSSSPPKKPAPSAGEDQDNVIALSRYRAQLSRGRRARRADQLFAGPHPERAIRALPADEFFYVLTELGFPDAIEVLHYGTAEQVQGALDFVLWDRDQLALERIDQWLGAMVEAPPLTLATWLRGLDVELVALLLRKRGRIYDISIDGEPEEPEGSVFPTPDRLFMIDMFGDPDQVNITSRLLDSLYRADRERARHLLVGARSELDSELEEMAYRWRSARMADLGFSDFYEALEIYREIDPASVRIGEKPAARARSVNAAESDDHLRLPMALSERLNGSSPFARAISGITAPEELAEIHFALVTLCNRALSADRVAPGDQEAMSPILERVAATLDLAIEFLARDDAERATAAVRSIPIQRLFQLGVSVIGKLRRLALALDKETPFARLDPAMRLFEADDAEVIASVSRLRPLFPRRLENPPQPGERPFASLSDVALVTAALERAAASVSLLLALGVRPEALATMILESANALDVATLDSGILARTALIPRLLGTPPAPLRPLSKALLTQFAQTTKELAKKGPEALRAAVHEVLAAPAAAGRLTPAMSAVADRWADSLIPLEPVVTDDGLLAPGQ